MSIQRQIRRGTGAENNAFTGAVGEVGYLTDEKRLVTHDGSTIGGLRIPNALDILNNALTDATATGTNTYAVTLPYFPAAYASGLTLNITFTNANSGASTLNVNGLGAVDLRDATGTAFASGAIGAGSTKTFRHNGTHWRQVVTGASGADYQAFTASGTWTKPASGTMARIQCWGGGGGARNGGGGGGGSGGGGYAEIIIPLTSLGATETVTIGAGGTSGGGAGGSTTFGSWLTAFGGGGADATGRGGGGAGELSAGSSFNAGRVGGGAGSTSTTTNGSDAGTIHGGGGGGGGSGGTTGGWAIWGGGGGCGQSGSAGGTSKYGGNGGGANVAGTAPGGGSGGGASAHAGARGECRVTVW